jgi:hypothetical protein
MSDIPFSTVNRKQFSWFNCQINTELHVCNIMWDGQYVTLVYVYISGEMVVSYSYNIL